MMHTLTYWPCSIAFARCVVLWIFAASFVTSPVLGDQMGGSVGLDILSEQVNEEIAGKPFTLDSLPTDVRLAARGSLDTFVDSVRTDETSKADPATWELEFTTDLKRNLQKPKKQIRDELGLLPSPDFYDERNEFLVKKSDGVPAAVLSSYEEVLSGGLLDSVIEADDANSESGKTLPVRPEPSGMAMMLMCLVSLIFVGSCTRILRPLRKDPIDLFRR